jgi:16S rRNA (cytosine967-C5)-methyltransferase
VQADVLQPPPFGARFDVVFVDAPCSGLGTLRRDPDIKWKRRESDLATLASRQLTMLRRAAEAVKPGGRLVYGTCSSEPEENEAVADAFSGTAAEFTPVDPAAMGPAFTTDMITPRGHLRTFPHVHGLEAFFGCVFHRRPL